MIRSLRARLFAATLGAVLIAVGVSLALGIVLTRGAVRSTIQHDLSRQADGLARALRRGPAQGGLALRFPAPSTGRPSHQPPPGTKRLPAVRGEAPPGAPPALKGLAVGASGMGELSSDTPLFIPIAAASTKLGDQAAATLRRSGKAEGTIDENGRTDLFAARLVRGQVVVARRSDVLSSSDFGRYLGGLLLASGFAVLLAALVAALFSRRIAAPIRRVSDASRVLASGASPPPVPREGPNEVVELAEAFNDLATQLGRAREAERSVLLSVSHELRTPLTSIRGYAEGIEDGTVDPPEAAAIIEREAGRLERLVGDLLALARLRQGVLEVRRESVDLATIALEAEQRLRPRARAADVRLEMHPNGPAPATADHDRALQVASNLIENAIRVTPAGPAVSLTVRPGVLEVADDGPGIPIADLSRAFERFHLRDRHGRGSPDGAGLGLSIVRELTEAMGGSVSVENQQQGGARFTVRLPS